MAVYPNIAQTVWVPRSGVPSRLRTLGVGQLRTVAPVVGSSLPIPLTILEFGAPCSHETGGGGSDPDNLFDGPLTISGLAQKNADPLVGADVRVFGDPLATTTTGAGGAYALTGARVGQTYTVVLRDPDGTEPSLCIDNVEGQ
jgi:hypothetical protein